LTRAKEKYDMTKELPRMGKLATIACPEIKIGKC
jgi:hypothetical protein